VCLQYEPPPYLKMFWPSLSKLWFFKKSPLLQKSNFHPLPPP
jgi:hypothetical protein